MTLFEILTTVIGSGVLGVVLRSAFITGKIVKTIEIIQRDLGSTKDELKMEISDIKQSIKDINITINSIDGRLSRLEGAFFERGQWEARSYKMAKDVHHQKHSNHY